MYYIWMAAQYNLTKRPKIKMGALVCFPVAKTKHLDQKQEGKRGRQDLFQLADYYWREPGWGLKAKKQEPKQTTRRNPAYPWAPHGCPACFLSSWPSWYLRPVYLFNLESPSQGCHQLCCSRPCHNTNRYKRKYNLRRKDRVVYKKYLVYIMLWALLNC